MRGGHRRTGRRGAGARGAAAAVAAVALVAVGACDGDPAGPAVDGAELVLAFSAAGAAMRPATADSSEPYEQACPAGGRVVVTGTATFELEGDERVHLWDQRMTFEECAMDVSRSPAVGNGEMHVFGEARFGPPVDQLSPILFQESYQVGTLTVRSERGSVTCDYDLAITWEAELDRYRISGTVCGRTVDHTAPGAP